YSQARRLDEILSKRQIVADRYAKLFSGVEGVTTPDVAKETTLMSWFVYVIRFDPRIDRDAVMIWLNEQGVQCRPYFTPIHLQPFYRNEFGYREGDFPVTEKVASSTLALPFFNRISNEEMSYVQDRVKTAVERYGR
ncbi:MAG TPA: DegT/DnrJ/EryC1/StrS family aminotransferase, partial [Bacillota bacterium]|nr:DegT/DnrJ/EryC1/StrS family aminotransferase [Bacillota bacterium]